MPAAPRSLAAGRRPGCEAAALPRPRRLVRPLGNLTAFAILALRAAGYSAGEPDGARRRALARAPAGTATAASASPHEAAAATSTTRPRSCRRSRGPRARSTDHRAGERVPRPRAEPRRRLPAGAGRHLERAVDRVGGPGTRRPSGRNPAAITRSGSRSPLGYLQSLVGAGRERALLAHRRADAGVGDSAGADGARRPAVPDLLERTRGVALDPGSGEPAPRERRRACARRAARRGAGADGPVMIDRAFSQRHTLVRTCRDTHTPRAPFNDALSAAGSIAADPQARSLLRACSWSRWRSCGRSPSWCRRSSCSDAVALNDFTLLNRPRIEAPANFLLHLLDPTLFILWGVALVAVALARERPRVALAVVAVHRAWRRSPPSMLKPLLAHPHGSVGYITSAPRPGRAATRRRRWRSRCARCSSRRLGCVRLVAAVGAVFAAARRLLAADSRVAHAERRARRLSGCRAVDVRWPSRRCAPPSAAGRRAPATERPSAPRGRLARRRARRAPTGALCAPSPSEASFAARLRMNSRSESRFR